MATTIDCSKRDTERLLAALQEQRSGLIVILADARQRQAFVERIRNAGEWRVQLCGTVRKYIGETEKNLRQLFERAEQHDVILVFDEADALFGKRTRGDNARDGNADQGVARLLEQLGRADRLSVLALEPQAHVPASLQKAARFVIRCD